MPSHLIAKTLSKKLGLYPLARKFNRHFLNKDDLIRYNTDIAFYKQFIRKDDLVFDIGANYGEKTEVFLALGAKVIACEPQEDCCQELINRCGVNDKYTVVKSALGKNNEIKKFYARKYKTTSGFVEDWTDEVESTYDIETITLDYLINKYGKPTYCKIDVEGFEKEVLMGLSENCITNISFEYHLDRQSDKEKATTCIDYLGSIGNYKFNITPHENLVFGLNNWLDANSFKEMLSNSFVLMRGYGYGDIFAKLDI